MSNLDNALRELRERRSRAQAEIDKLEQVISEIQSLNEMYTAMPSKTAQPIRIVSAASRRKMALAQKARWAGLRKNSQPVAVMAKPGAAPAKRKLSAAGRKRIAEATRARWAKFRAAKKNAT